MGKNIKKEKRPSGIFALLKHWRFKLTVGEGSANYSLKGQALIFILLGLLVAFSMIPLLMSVCMSFKPINELFFYPPRIFPVQPTLDNYSMMFTLASSTWMPFSRYVFNTVFLALTITVLHVLLAAMAAYPLAKAKFKGKALFNWMILFSLMFVATVTDVANYMTISWFRWLDTYWAVIIPAVGAPLGLFLMRNYMSTIPDTLIEASKMDGANNFVIFWRIIMPIVKPAWLTVGILIFQQVWSQPSSVYLYKEELKTLSYALHNIVGGGLIRIGAAQAVGVVMLIVPAVVFIVGQSKIMNTMVSSGIKE